MTSAVPNLSVRLTTMVVLFVSVWAAPAVAGSSSVELLFVPAGDGPSVVFRLDERPADGSATKRTVDIAWARGERSWSWRDEDVVSGRHDEGLGLPAPPRGLLLTPGPKGGLLFTVADLGPWQDGLEPAKPRLRRPQRDLGPPVVGKTAARLWVGPLKPVEGGDEVARATLFGAEQALEGRVILRRERRLGGVIGDASSGLEFDQLASIDAQSACGAVIPRALWAEEEKSVTQVTVGKVACLKDGRAVAEVVVRKLTPRGAKEASATLITEAQKPPNR